MFYPDNNYQLHGKIKFSFDNKLSCHSLSANFMPIITTNAFYQLFYLIHISALQGIKNILLFIQQLFSTYSMPGMVWGLCTQQ